MIEKWFVGKRWRTVQMFFITLLILWALTSPVMAKKDKIQGCSGGKGDNIRNCDPIFNSTLFRIGKINATNYTFTINTLNMDTIYYFNPDTNNSRGQIDVTDQMQDIVLPRTNGVIALFDDTNMIIVRSK